MADFIRLENVSYSYHVHGAPGTPALSHIDLKIERGEWVALVGTNGSGKSTLAKLLNALLVPSSGKVTAAGLDTSNPANHTAIRTQVGMVFQRPQDQIVASTVEEEIAFGPGNLGLSVSEVRTRVEDALQATNLQGLRDRHPFLLSAGEAQRLALAGVLAMRPQCIIFDESTAMLDPGNREAVMQQAKDLHQQGITILMITHLMQEAARCQRVIVLHKGQIEFDGSPSVVFTHGADLVTIGLEKPPAMIGAERLRKFFPALPAGILTSEQLLRSLPVFTGKMQPKPSPLEQSTQAREQYAIIDIRDLSHTYQQNTPSAHPALDGVSIQVKCGSMHGLIGMSGCGKSTLLQHINALIRPQTGRVEVGGFDLNDNRLDTNALRRMVSLAFQQPEDQIFEPYVGDEIAYGPRNLGYEGKLADVVEAAMHAVGLDFESYRDRLTSELSGGERRKVALASILAIDAHILLLDEPLAGLDPQSRKQVIDLLHHMRHNGKTLLVSTHQYETIGTAFDAISLLLGGKDILHGSPNEVFTQFDILRSARVRPPLYARVGLELKLKGWPIQENISNQSTLETVLERMLRKGL